MSNKSNILAAGIIIILITSCSRPSKKTILPLAQSTAIMQDNQQENFARLSYLYYDDQIVVVDNIVVNKKLWQAAEVTWFSKGDSANTLLQSSSRDSTAPKIVTGVRHKGMIRLPVNDETVQTVLQVQVRMADGSTDEDDGDTGKVGDNDDTGTVDDNDDTGNVDSNANIDTPVREAMLASSVSSFTNNAQPSNSNQMVAYRLLTLDRERSRSKITQLTGSIDNSQLVLMVFVDGYSARLYVCWSRDGLYQIELPRYRSYDLALIAADAILTGEIFNSDDEKMKKDYTLTAMAVDSATSYQVNRQGEITQAKETAQLNMKIKSIETVPIVVLVFEPLDGNLYFNFSQKSNSVQSLQLALPLAATAKVRMMVTAANHKLLQPINGVGELGELIKEFDSGTKNLSLAADLDDDGLLDYADADDDDDGIIDENDLISMFATDGLG